MKIRWMYYVAMDSQVFTSLCTYKMSIADVFQIVHLYEFSVYIVNGEAMSPDQRVRYAFVYKCKLAE